MEQFVTLYFKELRNMKRLLLIMLGIIVGYLLYANFFIKYIDYMYPSHLDRFVMYLLNHILYLFPILFVYSLYRGENQTIYQSELYQNQKHKILLIKFFIFVDALILMTIIIFINYLLITYDILPRPKTVGAAAVGDLGFVISNLIGYFCGPFISLSLVCTAWGVMQIVKRFRLYLGLAVMGAGLLSYNILILKGHSFGKTFVEDVSYILFTIFLGSIFCAVGIYLVKKFGKAQ